MLSTVVGSHSGVVAARREEEADVWSALVAQYADDVPPSPFTLPIVTMPAPPLFDPTMNDRAAVKYVAALCINIARKRGQKPASEFFHTDRAPQFRAAVKKARESMTKHAVPPAAFIHFAYGLWDEWRAAGYVKGETPHYMWLLDTKRLEEQRWMFSKERGHYMRTPALFAPDRAVYAREWLAWKRVVIDTAPTSRAAFLSTVLDVFGVDNLRLRAHRIVVEEQRMQDDVVGRIRRGEFVW